MIARFNQMIADRDREKGFTLVELLVVIIIIGILAAIAIPAFLNQRTKGYDASAKSDLKNASTSMETFYTDSFAYPTTKAALAGAGFNSTTGVNYKAYVNNGANAGYVIIAKHAQSGQVWSVSSYNGGAPTKSSVADTLPLPSAGAEATALKIPTGVNLTAFTDN